MAAKLAFEPRPRGEGGAGASVMSAAMAASRSTSNELLFAIDGQRHALTNPDPAMTLSDYLRATGHTSVKIGCGEGGCGACMVTVASWDPATKETAYKSVNSCLVPLCSCGNLSITTSSGLGNSVKGFHPIQQRLAEHNGSQCGFCSPGMVMSIFGLLSSQKGETCPDEKKLEGCIDGNLCRCTGYRPILAAARSFSGMPKKDVAGEAFAPFPEFLKSAPAVDARRQFSAHGKEWLSPATLEDLWGILSEKSQCPAANVAMVAGHTARGIYKDDHAHDVLVDVSRVPDLSGVDRSASAVTFGATTTWGAFVETLEGLAAEGAGKPEFAAWPVLLEHALKVAGPGIRNLGTLGGNLAMTKKRGFQSDLAPILAGAGAHVVVMRSKAESADVPIDEFFSSGYVLPEPSVLKSIVIPFLQPGEMFKTFRTAMRPVNSHALTNAAFAVRLSGDVVESARLVFGALGSRDAAPGPSDPETSGGASGAPVRARGAEAVLLGSRADDATLQAALAALANEPWWPEDEFERHLASGYLCKLFHHMRGSDDKRAPILGVSQSSERPVTEGTQMVTWATPDMAPIAEAMPKLSSKLQAAGEQRFTNDLPEPVGCLYAAYVLIPRARAVLVGYDLAAAREMPGFVDVVSAEDIPGKNTCEMTKAQLLLVPKGEASQFAGSPCLVVLADSTKHAEAAARAVELHLELPQEAPVLSIEACVERQQEADDGKRDMDSPVVKKKAKTVVRGNAAKALEESAHRVQGKVACDGQKAFYMEPPCALVTPGEDSTLTVWGSYQVPSWAHAEVAATSGLPKHKILMNATHIGGGFGGKLTKPLHAVCAASVAALKTRRPVRFHVNRNVDTVVCAGRHPMSFEYDVGFDAAGKLSAVQAVIHADAGLGDACSGFSLMIATQNMEQIYGIPHLDIEGIMCTTDKPGNTAVRGPGEPQAALFIETIIEHVAAELGKDSQEVREANIFTSPADMAAVAADPTSPEVEKYSAMLSVDAKDCAGRDFKNFPALGIWTSLKEKTDYAKRAAATAAFNQEHRFRKRGLAMTPVKYAVGARNQQATVCLYTDGTCLISCDGTEIGQGLHTKVIQYASYYLSQLVPGCAVPLKDIRVGPNGTDKIAHGSITGGSTTSEGVCEAVRDAIGKLKENLQPTREKLEASGKEITLVGLLGAASGSAELQASGKNHNALDYHCFGAALSEVEIDVMTGEVVILSTSIMYDCGKSLNPTIDLGQAEGAFMMGVGFYLRERLIQDSVTGKLATDGTWEYKIPCAQDVPLKFDVEFFPRAFTEGGISSSKASGEPPLVLASSVFAAVKQAIRAGRKEFGTGDGNFRLDAPCTPRDIALAVGAAMDCR